MNRISITLLLLLAGIHLTAQNSETRKLDSFERVSVSQGIDAFLSEGSSESARIEVEGDIELDEVLTDISGGTLKIHLEDNNYRNADVTVYLTYVSLEGLKASSAASIEVKNQVECDCTFEIDVSSAGDVEVSVTSNALELEASSAGDIDLKVRTGDIEASVSSAGDIDIQGTADEVEIKVSSSGDFSGYDLKCETAELRASSGGSIKIEVNERISARASSGGSISYKGDPEYADKESSSGGSIRGN